MYERGEREPDFETLEAIADYFNVDMNYLTGWEDDSLASQSDIRPYAPTRRIPILGHISAGKPLLAEQHIEGYMMTELNGGAEYFALRVRGDSMNAARLNDGDVIVVRCQEEVENGQIAVVMVGDQDATVKKYYRNDNTVSLVPQSFNPEHQMQIYDVSKTPIKVLGLVVQNIINM